MPAWSTTRPAASTFPTTSTSARVPLGPSSTNPPRTEGHPFNVIVLNDGTLVASYSGRRNHVGAFTASSGLFVSTDGGTTWLDRSDAGMQYWTWDVVVDPSDATQSTWYRRRVQRLGRRTQRQGRLYKTTNRGTSWTKINSLDRVASLTIDPTESTISAYLTTETDGLWYTTNLHAASPTFTRVASYPFRQPTRVFFNPNDPTDVWVTSFGGGLMEGRTVCRPASRATQVNDGSAQRSRVTSLKVTFNQSVTLVPGAFSISGPSGNVSYTLDTSRARHANDRHAEFLAAQRRTLSTKSARSICHQRQRPTLAYRLSIQLSSPVRGLRRKPHY